MLSTFGLTIIIYNLLLINQLIFNCLVIMSIGSNSFYVLNDWEIHNV